MPVILLSARAGEEARIEGHASRRQRLPGQAVLRAGTAGAGRRADPARGDPRRAGSARAAARAESSGSAPVALAILRGPDSRLRVRQRTVPRARGASSNSRQTRARRAAGTCQSGCQATARPCTRVAAAVNGQILQVILDSGASTGRRRKRSSSSSISRSWTTTARVDAIAVVAVEVTELTNARREAERANRAKDEFIAMLSHELRNPLSPILTALQLMRVRGVDGAERERTIIERQVGHLVGLVDDLLDVSRITRGKIELKKQHVELADIVSSAVETVSPLLEERRHTLDIRVPPEGCSIHADQDRIAQVVSNLLTNAAKYTEPSGLIEVTAARDAASVVIAVRDSGIGIEPEMQSRVFDVFTQATPGVGSLSRRPGSGPGDREKPGHAARRHGGGVQRRTRPGQHLHRAAALCSDAARRASAMRPPRRSRRDRQGLVAF